MDYGEVKLCLLMHDFELIAYMVTLFLSSHELIAYFDKLIGLA